MFEEDSLGYITWYGSEASTMNKLTSKGMTSIFLESRSGSVEYVEVNHIM